VKVIGTSEAQSFLESLSLGARRGTHRIGDPVRFMFVETLFRLAGFGRCLCEGGKTFQRSDLQTADRSWFPGNHHCHHQSECFIGNCLVRQSALVVILIDLSQLTPRGYSITNIWASAEYETRSQFRPSHLEESQRVFQA